MGALLVLADHVAARPRGSAASRQAQQIQLPLPPTPPFKQDLARSAETAGMQAAVVAADIMLHGVAWRTRRRDAWRVSACGAQLCHNRPCVGA